MSRQVERTITLNTPMYIAFPFQPMWLNHLNSLQLSELEWWVSVDKKFTPRSDPVSPW